MMLSPLTKPTRVPAKTGFAAPYGRVALAADTLKGVGNTTTLTLAIALLKFAGSLGVKITETAAVPTSNTVFAG